MSLATPPKTLFDLKSTAWTLTALRLHSADVAALAQALDARFGDTPDLFDDEALVIDLSPLAEADPTVDFEALLPALRRHRLRPVAVQGGSLAQAAAARAAGLAEAMDPEPVAQRAVPDVVRLPEPSDPPEPEPAPARVPVAEAPPRSTLVIDRPLRSGQRVYARGGDLVVLSVVSFGAEVAADGHIHVYAPLRGRAMAGARGDTSARIFSTCMEPQLVSIAGIYRTTETPLPDGITGRAAQVRLQGESLIVEPLGA